MDTHVWGTGFTTGGPRPARGPTRAALPSTRSRATVSSSSASTPHPARPAARSRADTLYRRFLERVPIENLSDQRACRERPWRPSVAEGDRPVPAGEPHLRARGRSFTVAYALADLMRGLGLGATACSGATW